MSLVRALPVFKQGVVELPEVALLGGAFRAHRGDYGFFADHDEVAIYEPRLAGVNIVVNDLSPWPEGEVAAVYSLEIGEFYDGYGRVFVAERVDECDGIGGVSGGGGLSGVGVCGGLR